MEGSVNTRRTRSQSKAEMAMASEDVNVRSSGVSSKKASRLTPQDLSVEGLSRQVQDLAKSMKKLSKVVGLLKR